MRKVYAVASIAMVGLFAIAMWKNSKSYSLKPIRWQIGKSFVDSCLVILSALYLPGVLVGLTVAWLTRRISSKGIQITASVVLGVVFGSVSGFALEILCLTGIFAVDLLTGQNGVYGWWKEGPPDGFLSGWSGNHTQEIRSLY